MTAPTTGTHDPNTFSLHFDTDPPLRLSQTLRCPSPTHNDGPFRVVGSVDGLVLLSDDLLGYTFSMVLWNPSIRKQITLPSPRFNRKYLRYSPYGSMFGFGLDSAGDYKIVRLVYRLEPGIGNYDFQVPPLAEVFSLRDRSWSTVDSSSVDYLMIETFWGQCFLNSCVHWIAYKKAPQCQDEIIILLFDVGKEKFMKMALPKVGKGDVLPPMAYTVSVIRGFLSVLINHMDRGLLRLYETHIHIWVKRDYCSDIWTKIWSIDIEKLQVGLWLNLNNVCGQILSGMGRDGEAGDIQVPPKVGYMNMCDFIFTYHESLVLLDQDTAIEEVCKALDGIQLGTNARIC